MERRTWFGTGSAHRRDRHWRVMECVRAGGRGGGVAQCGIDRALAHGRALAVQPRLAAPVGLPRALQHPLVAHDALDALAVGRRAEVAGGQRRDQGVGIECCIGRHSARSWLTGVAWRGVPG